MCLTAAAIDQVTRVFTHGLWVAGIPVGGADAGGSAHEQGFDIQLWGTSPQFMRRACSKDVNLGHLHVRGAGLECSCIHIERYAHKVDPKT